MTEGTFDPHGHARVLQAGAPLYRAKAAVVMLHGRGAEADNMLEFAGILAQPDLTYLAPQAKDRSWYPYSFLAPIDRNEPFLSSALKMLGHLLDRLDSEHHLGADQIVLLGFSQGACLTVEYAARNAHHYGGVMVLSGGLIGPEDTSREYHGRFSGTPVFLGCSDIDPHIPLERVRETSRVLSALGAVVTERIYPGMGHTINDDEIKHIRAILAKFATHSADSSSL